MIQGITSKVAYLYSSDATKHPIVGQRLMWIHNIWIVGIADENLGVEKLILDICPQIESYKQVLNRRLYQNHLINFYQPTTSISIYHVLKLC